MCVYVCVIVGVCVDALPCWQACTLVCVCVLMLCLAGRHVRVCVFVGGWVGGGVSVCVEASPCWETCTCVFVCVCVC